MTEVKCGYYLPTDSTPEAQKHTTRSHFCDLFLQNLIAAQMFGQKPESRQIDCSNYLNCPYKIEPINSIFNQVPFSK